MGRSKEVDAWFARYENPLKDVVQRARDIVLGADARIDECIKWQAPTFMYRGNLASFFPKSQQHASLMFHVGAKIPGKHPWLEGSGGTGRVMKIGSVAGQRSQGEPREGRPGLVRVARRGGGRRRSKAGEEAPGSGEECALTRGPAVFSRAGRTRRPAGPEAERCELHPGPPSGR